MTLPVSPDEQCITEVSLLDACNRFRALAEALNTPDGGFTVDPETGYPVTSGYAVYTYPHTAREYTGRITPSNILHYFDEMSAEISQPATVVDGWRDPSTGMAYLDILLTVYGKDDAQRAARRLGQHRIYDFSARQNISVTRSNTIVPAA